VKERKYKKMMAQIEGYDPNDEKKIKVFFIRK
jgi:hypothetical protein